MIIDCISDLHGFYPKLDGGDLLIVAGDLTARDRLRELDMFNEWIMHQEYTKKIVIGGNHDGFLTRGVYDPSNPIDGTVFLDPSVDYLCDSGTEFKGLKIWGSPWTRTFEGMNPHCKAFTYDTEEELATKFSLIPQDVDILITHSPPFGILDGIENEDGTIFHVGSHSLAEKIGYMENPPKLWVWGHIHEAYGEDLAIRRKPCKMINASHVNERYQPVNKPIRVIL